MKKIGFILLILLACFTVAQFFGPDPENISGEKSHSRFKLLTNVPDRVENILRNSCYDCHSSQPDLSWFDRITPANYLVASHIREGREALDFSKWDSLPTPQQNAKLYYALNKVLAGEMPLPSYTLLHRDAGLTTEDIRTLKTYINSLTPRKYTERETKTMENKPSEMLPPGKKDTGIAPSPNGINYVPGYRDWKVISTTDRFDNGSMRIIYANDIAVEAIRSGHTNPWPDGTVFAKTAWKQQPVKDGVVRTGDFIQVEFMIKDSRKYRDTKGWGWARWRGDNLVPYGEDKNLAEECITCHRPVKNSDYVFTTPLNPAIFTKPE